MGKKPCCDESEVKKGAWSPEEDQILVSHIKIHGHGTWRSLPKKAGLLRCGKSCRLRWTNYLRPGIKRGPFTLEEENAVIRLHGMLGNRWAAIATQIQGRTDNEIKNYWNTHLKKRYNGSSSNNNQPSLLLYHQNNVQIQSSTTRHMVQWESARLEAEVRLSSESSSLLNSFPNPSSDQFLVLWDSEVGTSFRGVVVNDGISNHNLPSQTTSTDKLGYVKSSDPREIEVKYEAKMGGKIANSNSFSHSDFSDSGNSVSELLLDFPGGYDSDFFEGKE